MSARVGKNFPSVWCHPFQVSEVLLLWHIPCGGSSAGQTLNAHPSPRPIKGEELVQDGLNSLKSKWKQKLLTNPPEYVSTVTAGAAGVSLGKPSPENLNAHQSLPGRMFKMKWSCSCSKWLLRAERGLLQRAEPAPWNLGFFGTSGSGGKEGEANSVLFWHHLLCHHRHVGFPTLLLSTAFSAAGPPTLLFPPWYLTRTSESECFNGKPFLLSFQVTTHCTSVGGVGSWGNFSTQASSLVIWSDSRYVLGDWEMSKIWNSPKIFF